MTYEEWLITVPDDLKRDSLWQFNIYPQTVFLYDLLWDDCEGLMKDVRGRAIAEQIIRSGGSISANIEEGLTWIWSRVCLLFARGAWLSP